VNAYLPSWADVKAAWTSGWKDLAARAAATYAAAVRADPTGTAARINGFVSALQDARAALDRIGPRLPSPPVSESDRAFVARYQNLDRRWRELAAGLFADAAPAPAPAIGVAPVLVVGGLAITAVGLAWAFAAYEYAANLKEQTALAERELDARVSASEAGRVLPPSTLPAPPPSPSEGARNVGLWLLAGLAIAAGALVVPVLLDRR
jgi:hypothetical protein